MSAIWQPYLTGVEPTTKKAILAYEIEIGKILPEDYKEALLLNQGKTTGKVIKVGSKAKSNLGPLLFLGEFADKMSYSIHREHKKIIEEYKTDDLIPFSINGGSGVFCFDYRTTDTNPKVIFVDYEFDLEDLGGGLAVADSFTDLLSKLED